MSQLIIVFPIPILCCPLSQYTVYSIVLPFQITPVTVESSDPRKYKRQENKNFLTAMLNGVNIIKFSFTKCPYISFNCRLPKHSLGMENLRHKCPIALFCP